MKTILIAVILFICAQSAVNAQKFKTLDYLYSILGKKTIAGQHNREPNAEPSKWTDSIYVNTKKYPGLWSGDFLFQSDNIANRWKMIYEAKKQWDKGAIVQIMFHTCPPTNDEPCGWNGGVLSSLTNSQWNDLITDETALNKNWKKRLDIIAPYLKYLKDNGVEVLFRPLHEMNQSAFWWGGRPGALGTAKLFRITHDYLTNVKGLTNLIWVWDMQDIDRSWAQYNPGDKYWDILGFDVYSDGFSQSWYNYALSIAGDKPLAIGECAKLPTSGQLISQPRYVFFMAWAELVFSSNSKSQISSLYNAQNVITLDELPGWKSICSFNGSPISLPGKIEAEDFDRCGENISYHDSDVENRGGKYRPSEGVDIEDCSDGGFNITNIKQGEWLAYSVKIDTAGVYKIKLKVSSIYSGKKIHLELDGLNISGPVSIPNSGSYSNWADVFISIQPVNVGEKTFKIIMDSGDFKLNSVSFILANKTPSEFKLFQNYPNPFNGSTKIDYFIPKSSRVRMTINDILGREVGTIINEDKKAGFYQILFFNDNLVSGVYFCTLKTDESHKTIKIVLIK